MSNPHINPVLSQDFEASNDPSPNIEHGKLVIVNKSNEVIKESDDIVDDNKEENKKQAAMQEEIDRIIKAGGTIESALLEIETAPIKKLQREKYREVINAGGTEKDAEMEALHVFDLAMTPPDEMDSDYDDPLHPHEEN
jgi:hypothetical protein